MNAIKTAYLTSKRFDKHPHTLYSIRLASNGLLPEDKTCKLKVTLGDRSLGAATPKTWNTLPKEIHDQTDVRTF